VSDYEGDVDPDVVAPGAATHSIPVPPSSEFVRSQVETVEGSESLSTELAEPVPVPASPSQKETPLSGGGPGFCGSVRLSPAGFNLGCPGSQTDPTTTVRGQTYALPEMEYRSGPLQSPLPERRRHEVGGPTTTSRLTTEEVDKLSTMQPPAHATAAAGDLTLASRCQNRAKNLYTIYFVFDLDGECKFVKTKHYSD